MYAWRSYVSLCAFSRISIDVLLTSIPSRRVYWSEQSSVRTKTLLMIDWIKRGIFGRDLSKVSLQESTSRKQAIDADFYT